MRECNGTHKEDMFTPKECEGCGRVYHNVCLGKMGYALEGDACMIEGAWYCKPCKKMWDEAFEVGKQEGRMEHNLEVIQQKEFVCAQCMKKDHKYVCDIRGCKRHGKPFDSKSQLDTHK